MMVLLLEDIVDGAVEQFKTEKRCPIQNGNMSNLLNGRGVGTVISGTLIPLSPGLRAQCSFIMGGSYWDRVHLSLISEVLDVLHVALLSCIEALDAPALMSALPLLKKTNCPVLTLL